MIGPTAFFMEAVKESTELYVILEHHGLSKHMHRSAKIFAVAFGIITKRTTHSFPRSTRNRIKLVDKV
eukprot:15345686-Ditylum_brightwellii.AAC.1